MELLVDIENSQVLAERFLDMLLVLELLQVRFFKLREVSIVDLRHRQGEVSVVDLLQHLLCLSYLLQFLLLVGYQVEDFLYEIQAWHSDRPILGQGLLLLQDGLIVGGLFGSVLELAIVLASVVHGSERLVVSVVLIVGVLPELIISASEVLILVVASVVVLVTPTSKVVIVVIVSSIIIMILVVIIVMTSVIRLVVVGVVVPVISIITFSTVRSIFRTSSLFSGLFIKKVVNCVQFLLLQVRVKGGLNVFHFTKRVFG